MKIKNVIAVVEYYKGARKNPRRRRRQQRQQQRHPSLTAFVRTVYVISIQSEHSFLLFLDNNSSNNNTFCYN